MRLDQLEESILELRKSSLLREPDDGLYLEQMQQSFGSTMIDAATNDYLGYASEALNSDEQSRTEWPTGARSSRLIFGSSRAHLKVEQFMADWCGSEAALLFPNGYTANLGALSALLSKEDAVFSDEYNHASLIDGIRLRSRAQVFPHLDLRRLETMLADSMDRPARWVIVESYYSMDGDSPDLSELRRLCDRYDAFLYVDEAHSFGVFGPTGAGLCEEVAVKADVLMCGFGKATASSGACVLGSSQLRTWLWNRARSFVFSTAPSPRQVHDLYDNLQRLRSDAKRRQRLTEIANQVRSSLSDAGLQLTGHGPILSLIFGEEQLALQAARDLSEQGIVAQAIRPPTVPAGASRLRVTMKANWQLRQVERLSEALIQQAKKASICSSPDQ